MFELWLLDRMVALGAHRIWDHAIQGRVLLPGAAMFEMGRAAAACLAHGSTGATCSHSRLVAQHCSMGSSACVASCTPSVTSKSVVPPAEVHEVLRGRPPPAEKKPCCRPGAGPVLLGSSIAAPLALGAGGQAVAICAVEAATGSLRILSHPPSGGRATTHLSAAAGACCAVRSLLPGCVTQREPQHDATL